MGLTFPVVGCGPSNHSSTKFFRVFSARRRALGIEGADAPDGEDSWELLGKELPEWAQHLERDEPRAAACAERPGRAAED